MRRLPFFERLHIYFLSDIQLLSSCQLTSSPPRICPPYDINAAYSHANLICTTLHLNQFCKIVPIEEVCTAIALSSFGLCIVYPPGEEFQKWDKFATGQKQHEWNVHIFWCFKVKKFTIKKLFMKRSVLVADESASCN